MSNCLWCQSSLMEIINLGSQPLANSLLTNKYEPEKTYPLIFARCEKCNLYQTYRYDYQCFGETYPYYSSIGHDYVNQCEALATRLTNQLNPQSVLEIGSNDGYMLRNFKDISHVGYEPSKGPHDVAIARGLNSRNEYFNDKCDFKADIIFAFNVLAHTPALREIIKGIKKCLNPYGLAVIEIQNVREMLKNDQFDCIYHEHYSYFEINTLVQIFKEEGLTFTAKEEIKSHGGSIRVFFSHTSIFEYEPDPWDYVFYEQHFIGRQKIYKHNLREFLMNQHRKFKNVALFGAPAKGNTFLNYCGIKSDEIKFAVDETPYKQNKFLPGSRIPVVNMDYFVREKPDNLIIMPWNFEESIRKKLEPINTWGMYILTPFELH